jgi:peroxiredoxin
MSSKPIPEITNPETLESMIAKFQADMLPNVPAETMQLLQQAGQEIAALGIEQHALKTGDRCPDFSLNNGRGESITSRELLSNGPLIISFYRGAWCPYCNLEIKALAQSLAEIRAQGAELVAISPQTPEKAEQQSTELKLDFEVLSDSDNALARRFGLVFTLPAALRPVYQAWQIDIPAHNGDQRFELPVPATYVVDREGLIRYHFVDSDYSRRLEPASIIEQLKRLP